MVWGRVIKVRLMRKEGKNQVVNFLAFNFELKELINQPTTGYLDVFNPSKVMVKTFFKEETRVQITAGYQSQGEGVIFDGDIISVESSRQGVDNKYTLHLQSHAELSYQPKNVTLKGATNKNILTIVNVGVDFFIEYSKLPLKTYNSFNMFATPLVMLRKVVSDARYVIYFQTQKRITFRHLGHNDFVSSFEIPQISLSSPITKSVKNQEETISFSTILNPSYQLLSTYILKTEDFQGEVYPTALTWYGNNFTGGFGCQIEGKLKGSSPSGMATGFLGKMEGDF